MKLSIIVPVLNEAPHLTQTLASVRDTDPAPHEILVVDGGSTDGTPDMAVENGASLLRSQPGRGVQMNSGGRAATGDTLLFLHGDSRLPSGYSHHIDHCLSEPGVSLGAFSLAIGAVGLRFRLVERLANLRSARFSLPYGDQGLFLRKETFERAGGFPEIPIMEDFLFVRTMAARGRVKTLALPIHTSARRWQNFGVIRTTLTNQCIVAGYYLGIPPDRLARFYNRLGGIGKKNAPP